MDSAIEEIKRKIDIVEYIGSFITLKKTGKNYKAVCPFHDEKTPSFVISQDRQIWRCFGACQKGGDVIAFLMEWENLTFFEALKELAQQAGVKLDNVKFEDRQWQQKEHFLKLNQLAAKYYHFILTEHSSGKAGLKYVTDRGVNEKLIKTFNLGYAPQSWDSLLKFLIKKGYSKKDILEAGLVIQKGDRFYDRFRGRLMFPIMDARHNVLGFSGRLLSKSEKQAKYVNTPETPVYHKRETLYGIHVAHDKMRKDDQAVITEGEFDMISCFKHGITNAVAIKGSAFTKQQLNLLKRYTKHLVLALDSDFSGTETTLRAIKEAEDMDFRIEVIRYDFGKDPDEALQKDPVAFKKLIKKPMPIYDFIIQTALERHDEKNPYEKKEIVSDILPFIKNISNPIVKAHYVKRLAALIDSEERDIDAMMRSFELKEKKREKNIPERPVEKTDRLQKLQSYILALMLQDEHPDQKARIVLEVLEPEDFTVPSYSEIMKAFHAYTTKTSDKDSNFEIHTFTKNFDSPLQRVLDELFLYDTTIHTVTPKDEIDSTRDFKRSLYQLKQMSLRHRIKEGAASGENTEAVSKWTKKLAQVEKDLTIL